MQAQQIDGHGVKGLDEFIELIGLQNALGGAEVSKTKIAGVGVGEMPDLFELAVGQAALFEFAVEPVQGKAERKALRVVGDAVSQDGVDLLASAVTERPEELVWRANDAAVRAGIPKPLVEQDRFFCRAELARAQEPGQSAF